MKNRFILLLATLFIFALKQNAIGQGVTQVIQLSGLVVAGDSSYGVPGVHLFIPNAGRGTTSNYIGYFSLPVLVGDSLVVRAMGYKDRTYIIPKTFQNSHSMLIYLVEDTLILPAVEIFPWSTEKLFKEAFLALDLPQTDINNMQKNLNDVVLRRMLYNMEADGSLNSKYYMQQQAIKQDMRFSAYNVPFFNPFAWSQFIDQVKKGGLKPYDPNE
jgi:hypothetical protein